MKVLAILLCFAISHVFGELEDGETGEENLRVSKDVLGEASSHVSVDVDIRPATQVENLRGNYAERNIVDRIAAMVKDSVDSADSVEKETPRNPSPVLETSTAKRTSSKAMENNLEIVHLRKPEKNHLNVLPNIISSKNTRSETRRKTPIDFLKSFFWYTDDHAQSHKRTSLASDEIRLLRRKRQADDPEDRIMSYRAYNKLRKKLPLPMRLKIRETQLAEDYLLDYWAEAGQSDPWRLNEYNRTRFEELEEFKKLVGGAGDAKQALIDNYKAVRKGVPWNYDKLRAKYKKFFSESSPGRTEYEAMKKKEYTWIESFLNGADVSALAAAGPKVRVEEEMERRVRAKDSETVEVEDGNAENLVATTEDANVEATNTATTTPTTQVKNGSSNLVRIAILFALVMQLIIAILILGPEMSKVAKWCKRRETEDDIIAAGEKEPLYRKRTLHLVRHGRTLRLHSRAW